MPALTSRNSSDKQSENQANGKKSNGLPNLGSAGRRESTVQSQKTNVQGSHHKATGTAKANVGKEATKEKPPSKDGPAQKAAGAVAGLKDYVGPSLFPLVTYA